MSENCLTCKFSRGQSEGLTCHRNPPYRDDRWAMTPDNESCGEFVTAPLNVVSPEPKPVVSITKKPHAKTPRRKGKHGQEESPQEA